MKHVFTLLLGVGMLLVGAVIVAIAESVAIIPIGLFIVGTALISMSAIHLAAARKLARARSDRP